MTRKEKAVNLVEKYKPYVYPYVGSSFMTGDEYPEQILSHSKQCALIAIDEVIKMYNELNELGLLHPNSIGLELHDIKTEIERL